MQNLNIEKFSPKKAELQALNTKYQSLTISGIDDVVGFKIVDEARKDLKTKRVEITKTGKELRQEARDFASEVIKAEKDLIAIIEPLEKELKDKQDKIKEEKAKIAMMALLPRRKEMLEKINVLLPDDEIIDISVEAFQEFYNGKHGEFLDKKANELKEKQEKLDREKELEETRKKAKKEAEEEAKIEAEEAKKQAIEREVRIKREAEEEKQKLIDEQKEKEKQAEEAKKQAVLDVERKAEKEKQDIIDENKRKEDERLRKEKRIKDEADVKEAKEKADTEALEKKKKYIKFLSDNGYTEATKSKFHIERVGNQMVLYKFISSFNI